MSRPTSTTASPPMTDPSPTTQADQPPTRTPADRQADDEASGEIIHAYASYQGPLPPAEQFKGYDEVLPGAAERILAMAEAEQRQYHAYDQTRLQTFQDDQHAHREQIRRGQYYGLVVCLSAIFAGAATAIVGALVHSISGIVIGGIIGGGGLASVIYAFTMAEPEGAQGSRGQGAQGSRGQGAQ